VRPLGELPSPCLVAWSSAPHGPLRALTTLRPCDLDPKAVTTGGIRALHAVTQGPEVQALAQAQSELAGHGTVTEQEVREAADAVERDGGRILPVGCAGPEFSHVEVPREEAASRCTDLAAKLGLDAEQTSKLLQAVEAGCGEERVFVDERQDSVLSSRYISYRLWHEKVSDKVFVVFGTYHARLEVDGTVKEGEPPRDHCVECEGRLFSVLPWKQPEDSQEGVDMVKERDDNWIDIPAGWRPYEVCKDFTRVVRPKVIAPYAWGTDVVLVRKGDHWPAWRTALRDHNTPGTRYCSHVDWFEVSKDGKKCVFRGEEVSFTPSKKLEPVFRPWNGRVLIERVPMIRLMEDWRAYMQLRAQADWRASLGTATQAA